MLENNLDIIRETQQFHFEDALNTRRGYYYPEEGFARGHTKSVWTHIQRFLSPLIEVLRVPRPSFGRVDCASNLVEC
jgi:hypothetical protein